MSESNRRIYYGWWIVAVAFLTLFTSFGIGIYSRSIFFDAMFRDLGWGRGELSLAMSVGAILAAAVSPMLGTWVDKYGPSKVVAASSFLVGGFLMLSSQIYTLWQAFIIFIGFGVARTGTMFIPFQVAVSNWFHKKRGRAMGIAMAGVGLGGFVFSPFVTYLIGEYGWRTSWVVVGLITWVVIIPPALLLLKKDPQSMGLLPDGEVPTPSTGKTEATTGTGSARGAGLTFWEVFKIPSFWLLAAIWVFFFWSEGAYMQHAFPLYTDRGIPEMTAGTLVGLTGLASLMGKLVMGYLTEKFPVRYVMGGTIFTMAFSLFLLLIGPSWIVWPFTMLYGFSMGATTGIAALLVASLFGVKYLGKILGTLVIFSSVSHMLSPTVTGYIFDATGSYDMALVVLAVAALPAVALTLLARPRQATV